MGWRVQLKYRRTVAALVLTSIAVAVPCAAWFFAGQRNIERQASAEEAGVFLEARKKGHILAERLEARLAALLQVENRRPFYHYQNLFHDPRGASAGAAVTQSPLAQGASDPLTEVHFQVDDEGKLTLPTLNEEFPELSLEGDHGERCALFAELSDIAAFCATGDGEGGETLDAMHRFATTAGSGRGHVESMSWQAWDQHLQASALYADLKYGSDKVDPTPVDGSTDSQTIQIVVSPFSWFTQPVGEQLNLVALRQVETPRGLWTQGFVVSLALVEQYLENSDYPVSFVPRVHSDPNRAKSYVSVPVDGTPWAVDLDVTANLQQALNQAASERQRFFGLFLLGALGAGLAGTLVVYIVFQSERLAHKRAQFAASAAHELRTPLAGLRLYSEMLAEGFGNPRQSQRYARRVANEAERLGRVVTNVLSFTRLERSAMTLRPEVGDLELAVREACKGLQPVLDESGAELVFEIEEDLPPVLFDRDAVVHIVHNLLDNAEKYTREVDGRRITLSLRSTGDGPTLEVADNGPGIPSRLRRKLFRPFERGEGGDDPEGLGLGLMLVRTLARAQGGDIRYSDGTEGGAVFTVTFARLPSAA